MDLPADAAPARTLPPGAALTDDTPPATRKWAITTLILAVLYLLMGAFSLSQMAKGPMAEMGDSGYLRGLTVAQLALAVAFVIGSVGALKNQAWGRLTVAWAAAGAVATIILAFFVQYGLRDNPAYLEAFADQMRKSSPQVAAMPDDALAKMAQTNAAVTFIVAAVMSVIQFFYCLALYWHMSAPPEEFGPAR
jgi:hypothetical protein